MPTEMALSLWRGLIAVRRTLSMAEIAEGVAAAHGLTVAQLRGASRLHPIVVARQEAMAIAHQHEHSTTKIGRWFGGRDHTTVIHAERAHAKRQGTP